MFAINHAASALLFKKHLKDQVSFIWILLAVQFVELAWAALNLLGIEKVTTEDTVQFVGDIHLSYMPYSHSILSSLTIAFLAALVFLLWKRSYRIALIMGLAFLAHIVLDILTHTNDLPLGLSNAHFVGLGLYSAWPITGFIFELAFGLFCWWYYSGNKGLFWVILLFNIANITMFVPQLAGLEYFMAHKPTLIVLVILAQILITLFLVGSLASPKPAKSSFPGD